MTALTWNVTGVSVDAQGVIAVQVAGGPVDAIVLQAEALGVRMALYGLATPQLALEAIMREHGARIAPGITLPTPPTTAADYGGTSADVAIVYADATVQQQIDAAIAAQQAVIDTAAANLWNDPRIVALRDGGSAPTPPPPSLPPSLPPPAQSPAAVAQAMADTIHAAVAGVPDGATVAQLRDAISAALAPYLGK